MKKGFIKAGVLLLLFLAALGGTAAFINRDKTVGTREMEEASQIGRASCRERV